MPYTRPIIFIHLSNATHFQKNFIALKIKGYVMYCIAEEKGN